MDPNQIAKCKTTSKKSKIEAYQSKRCVKIRRMAQKARQKESK